MQNKMADNPVIGRWPYVNWLDRGALKRSRWRRAKMETVILASLARVRGLHRETYITNASKFDGGGSQVHQTLSVQAFCKAFGVPYAHTPFAAMAHTPDQVERWEKRFDLGRGLTHVSSLDCSVVRLRDFLQAPWAWQKPCILSGLNIHPFINSNPTTYDLVRDRAIALYGGREPAYSGAALRVAVHVRRGDVESGNWRFTRNAEIARRIVQLRRATSGCGVSTEVTVFSQGVPDDFPEFLDLDVELRLEGDPLEALNCMIHADILMMAKSSLSYVAGLLNRKGLVIYEPYWHAPLPGWIFGIWDNDAGASKLREGVLGRVLRGPGRDRGQGDTVHRLTCH